MWHMVVTELEQVRTCKAGKRRKKMMRRRNRRVEL
jgi:hypothetical protein